MVTCNVVTSSVGIANFLATRSAYKQPKPWLCFVDLFDGYIQNSGLAFFFVMEFDSFRKKESNPSADSDNETQGEDDKKKK